MFYHIIQESGRLKLGQHKDESKISSVVVRLGCLDLSVIYVIETQTLSWLANLTFSQYGAVPLLPLILLLICYLGVRDCCECFVFKYTRNFQY